MRSPDFWKLRPVNLELDRFGELQGAIAVFRACLLRSEGGLNLSATSFTEVLSLEYHTGVSHAPAMPGLYARDFRPNHQDNACVGADQPWLLQANIQH